MFYWIPLINHDYIVGSTFKIRIKLLERSRQRNSLNVVSVLSSEVNKFTSIGGFGRVDILSMNINEAKSITDHHTFY